MSYNPIRLIVTNTVTYIEGKLVSEIYQAFRKELGYYPDDVIFKMKNVNTKKGYKWTGLISTVCYSRTYCHCSVKRDGTHFPSGLLSKARAFFTDHEVPFTLIDAREKVNTENKYKFIRPEGIEDRPYQNEIVEKSIKQQRGLIKLATGGGKSLCAAKIIAEVGAFPFIFYVTSKDLLWQAKKELERYIVDKDGKNIEIGVIGDGQKIIKDVNVMTVQTAIRALGEKYKKFDDEDEEENSELKEGYAEVKNLIMSANGFAADEVQHWAAESCQIISDYSEHCIYKWGLSATPMRDLNDDILIDACFGKQIVDINASFLIDLGYLMKPDIYIIPMKHDGVKGFSYQELYKKCIVENTIRNQYIANIAKEMRDNGRVVLILCKHIAHGNILQAMIEDSVFLHGIHSSKVRKEHLDILRKRTPSVTISTVIFDEGIDVCPLDTLILAGSGKSATRALQRVGRTLRKYPGKKDAIIIDFEDHCKYMYSHSKKRIKMYKTEPRFNIEYWTNK